MFFYGNHPSCFQDRSSAFSRPASPLLKPLFARNGLYLGISSLSSRGIVFAMGRVNPTSGQGSNRGGPLNRQMIDAIAMNEKCLKAYAAGRFGNSSGSRVVGNDGDLGSGWLRKRNNRRNSVRSPQP